MKMNRDSKIEKCVSKDETRQVLSEPYLDVDKKRLIATDGRMLVSLLVEVEDGDTSGHIPEEVIKRARKLAPKYGKLVVSANGNLSIGNGTETFKRPEMGEYPKCEQVIPTNEPTLKVGLNPKFLLSIAEALGNPDSVVLSLTDDKKAIVIKTNSQRASEDVGVLMPIRIA